ncbi:MAG: hypothetical protein HC836_23180 [Richelia sp. RM2_1_2]|nr:hypothetical protein [Richelia sp. RM2_1_2]
MKKIFLGLLVFLALSVNTASAELSLLGVIPNTEWNLYADLDAKACVITASYESETSILIQNNGGNYSVVFVNNNWELGNKKINVGVVFDNKKVWNAEFITNKNMIFVDNVKAEFITDVSRAQVMELYTPERRRIVGFNLTGTTIAIKALGNCAEKIKQPVVNPKNPFIDTNPNSPKPFGE